MSGRLGRGAGSYEEATVKRVSPFLAGATSVLVFGVVMLTETEPARNQRVRRWIRDAVWLVGLLIALPIWLAMAAALWVAELTKRALRPERVDR